MTIGVALQLVFAIFFLANEGIAIVTWTDLSLELSTEWEHAITRIGTRVCASASGEAALLWGGADAKMIWSAPEDQVEDKLNQVLMFKSDQTFHELPLLNGTYPELRKHHTMCGPLQGIDSSLGDYVVFGGQEAQSKHLYREYSDSLLVLHYNDSGIWWTRDEVDGEPPIKRMGHAAACEPLGKSLYLFGGYRYVASEGTPHETQLDDLYLLRRQADGSFAWSNPSTFREPTTMKRPTFRYDHSLDWFDTKLVMFGGVTRGQGRIQYHDETWVLQAPDANSLAHGESLGWINPFVTDETSLRPSARAGHASVRRGRDLLIFGGHTFFDSDDREPTLFNDVWKLDTGSYEWSQLTPVGAVPPGRSWHTGVLVSSSKVLSFGGAVLFDVGNSEYMTTVEPQAFLLEF